MQQYIDSLTAEIRSGYYVTEQRKVVWNIQLNMAKCLLDVCERHNLRIWGVAGTMLGAVRHKGFIPWDDDMDFMMFREDYDRLQKIAPREFKSPFFFQSPYTEVGYYRGHSQLRYSDSAMILPEEAKDGYDFNQGVFIDIFVADGFPEDEQELSKLLEGKKLILDFLWNRYYFLRRIKDVGYFMYFLNCIKQLGIKALWTDKRLYAYMEDLFKAYPINTHERLCWTQFAYLPRWVRRLEWFEDTIEVPFEKITLPIPSRYDEILRSEYGDYMQFVKGASYHSDVIVEPDKSYKKYLPGLRFPVIKAYYRISRILCGVLLRKLGFKR